MGKTVVVGEYNVVVATLDGEHGWKHDLLSVSSFLINGMATISSASTGVEFIMETYTRLKKKKKKIKFDHISHKARNMQLYPHPRSSRTVEDSQLNDIIYVHSS